MELNQVLGMAQSAKSQLAEIARQIPQNNIINNGTLISDFEDLSMWTITGNGTLTADTANKVSGSQAGKFTVTTAGSYGSMTKAVKIDKINSISYDLYVTDKTKLYYVTIYLASVTDGSKKITYALYSDSLYNGWNHIKFSPTETEDFTDTWGNIILLKIAVGAKSGETTNVTIDNLYINQKTKAKVMLRFDGPYATVYTKALPILQKYGFKGVIDVLPSGVIAGGDFATLAQLLSLQNTYGWDIAGHGYASADFSAITAEQAVTSVNQCRDWQIANGLASAVNHMSYPGGQMGLTTAMAVSGTQIKSAMGGGTSKRPQLQPIPSTQMWMLNFAYTWAPALTFATDIKPIVDKAVELGGLLSFYTHGVEDVPTVYAAKTAEFQLFIDYIALLESQGLIDVVTVNEWYDEYMSVNVPKDTPNWAYQNYRGFATPDMASIAANGIATFNITVNGAKAGDVVFLSAPAAIEAGLIWSGYVSAANTVTVRIHNTTAGAIDPAIGTWMARVIS